MSGAVAPGVDSSRSDSQLPTQASSRCPRARARRRAGARGRAATPWSTQPERDEQDRDPAERAGDHGGRRSTSPVRASRARRRAQRSAGNASRASNTSMTANDLPTPCTSRRRRRSSPVLGLPAELRLAGRDARAVPRAGTARRAAAVPPRPAIGSARLMVPGARRRGDARARSRRASTRRAATASCRPRRRARPRARPRRPRVVSRTAGSRRARRAIQPSALAITAVPTDFAGPRVVSETSGTAMASNASAASRTSMTASVCQPLASTASRSVRCPRIRG